MRSIGKIIMEINGTVAIRSIPLKWGSATASANAPAMIAHCRGGFRARKKSTVPVSQ